MTRRASDHMERVASLGCVLCHRMGHGYTPAEVHHVFDTAARSDFLTVGLCPEHHRGATGFHGAGQRAFERMHKTSEAELLALTIERLTP
jgi:hypothetical protein